jgi:hypothetical protein
MISDIVQIRCLSIALIVSVLLLSSKASLFQTSAKDALASRFAIAQVPMPSMPSNLCSALMQRDFAAASSYLPAK